MLFPIAVFFTIDLWELFYIDFKLADQKELPCRIATAGRFWALGIGEKREQCRFELRCRIALTAW